MLRDGRSFDVHRTRGLVRMQDADGHALQISDNGLHHTAAQSLFFMRDAQGRITRITDPEGRSLKYGYDLAGDLAYVDKALNERTSYVYRSDIKHHLQ